MKITKKQVNMIVDEIERFGECYIGRMEIFGAEYMYKLYTRVGRAYEEKHQGFTIAYDKDTGYAWEV